MRSEAASQMLACCLAVGDAKRTLGYLNSLKQPDLTDEPSTIEISLIYRGIASRLGVGFLRRVLVMGSPQLPSRNT
jgi:hypothetical protein